MKFTETWWWLQGSLGSIGPNLGPILNMLWCFYPVNIQQWHQSSCQISSMDVLAEITMRKEFNGHESLEPPPLSPVCADFNPNVPLLIQCVCVWMEHLNRCKTSTWWCRFLLFVWFSFFSSWYFVNLNCRFQLQYPFYSRGQERHGKSPANKDTYHRRWYQTWPVWRTCIVVITCCSGFASIQISFSDDGKRLNPRTSMAACAISCTVVAICQLISSSIYFGDSIFSLISRVFSPTHSCQV